MTAAEPNHSDVLAQAFAGIGRDAECQSNRQFRAYCPVHRDKNSNNASLRITFKGEPLAPYFKCSCGASAKEIVKAAGLEYGSTLHAVYTDEDLRRLARTLPPVGRTRDAATERPSPLALRRLDVTALRPFKKGPYEELVEWRGIDADTFERYTAWHPQERRWIWPYYASDGGQRRLKGALHCRMGMST